MTGFLNTIGARLGLLVLVVITPIVFSSAVFAVAPTEETGPTVLETVKAGAIKSGYRLAIATCLRDRLGFTNTTVSAGDVSGGNIIGSTILGSNQINVGSLIRPNADDNTGRYMCSELNGAKLDEAKAAYGQGDGTRIEFFCGTKAIKRMDGSDCVTGTGDFGHDNSFDNAKANLNGGQGYQGPQLYLTAYYELVQSGCKMRDPILDASANLDVKNTKLKVSIVNSAGGINTVWYTVNLTKNVGVGSYFAYPYVQQEDGSNINLNCTELIDEMGKHASEYGLVVAAASVDDKKPDDNGGNTGVPGGDNQSTCNVEGVGWIVCPVMTFLSEINDKMYEFISGFLAVPPSIFGNDSQNGVYGAWNSFRGIANVLFIVAFLIIIYSQVTSVGITNYGVKKLLPKLIIAAVLVNASYYICQFAVDISNILGYGLMTLFTAIGGGVDSGSGSVYGWQTVVSSALMGAAVGTAAVAGAVSLALAVSVPVLLAGLLSLLMLAVILIARQAIIVLLIAVSPLAFVAWLLPNTQKLFKRWWDLFFAMLVLFPVVSALFGAGALAATILSNMKFSDTSPLTTNVMQLAALGAGVLPLFAVIPLLQNALKGAGALGEKLGGLSKKASSNVGTKVKTDSKLGRGITAGLANRASRRHNNQDAALAKGRNRAFGRIVGGKGYNQSLQGRVAAVEDKEHNEAVQREMTALAGKGDDAILAQARDKNATVAQRQAAVSHLMQKGSHDAKKAAIESITGIKGGKGDADGIRARAALADEYAKSDMSSLLGKNFANDLRGTGTISVEKQLRKNLGSISPQSVAGSEKYAQDVAAAYQGSTPEQQDAIHQMLDGIESSPQLLGAMSPETKKALRTIRPGFAGGTGGGGTTPPPSGGSGTPPPSGGSGGSSTPPSGGGSPTPPSPSGGGPTGPSSGGGSTPPWWPSPPSGPAGSGRPTGPSSPPAPSGGTPPAPWTPSPSGGGSPTPPSPSGGPTPSSSAPSGSSPSSTGPSGPAPTPGPLPGGGTTNLFSSGVTASPHSSSLVQPGTPTPSASASPASPAPSSSSPAPSSPTPSSSSNWGERVGNAVNQTGAAVGGTLSGVGQVVSGAGSLVEQAGSAAATTGDAAVKAAVAYGKVQAAPTIAEATTALHSSTAAAAPGVVIPVPAPASTMTEPLSVDAVEPVTIATASPAVEVVVSTSTPQSSPTIPKAPKPGPSLKAPETATPSKQTLAERVASARAAKPERSAPPVQISTAADAGRYLSSIAKSSPQMSQFLQKTVATIAKERGMTPDDVMKHLNDAGTTLGEDTAKGLTYLMKDAHPKSEIWNTDPGRSSMAGALAQQYRTTIDTALRAIVPPKK